MVIANDNTVASGVVVAAHAGEDRARAEMALRLRLPVDLPRRLLRPVPARAVAARFPGAHRRRPHLQDEQRCSSAAGVPQIAGVFGDCIAGGGYMPIICDRVYMTEQAYMVIAGAALIKGAKSQKLT